MQPPPQAPAIARMAVLTSTDSHSHRQLHSRRIPRRLRKGDMSVWWDECRSNACAAYRHVVTPSQGGRHVAPWVARSFAYCVFVQALFGGGERDARRGGGHREHPAKHGGAPHACPASRCSLCLASASVPCARLMPHRRDPIVDSGGMIAQPTCSQTPCLLRVLQGCSSGQCCQPPSCRPVAGHFDICYASLAVHHAWLRRSSATPGLASETGEWCFRRLGS